MEDKDKEGKDKVDKDKMEKDKENVLKCVIYIWKADGSKIDIPFSPFIPCATFNPFISFIPFKNIARGTTDPGIASITWIISPATKQANSLERKIQVKHSIGSNFGQMTLPALVLNLPTRWRHLKIQIKHSIGSNFGH